MVLAVLWFVAFALVLIGYRPGGPVDVLVGLAAAGPILVAVVAIAWPPVARGDRAFAATAWLGLAAVLLLIPSIAGIVAQLVGRGPQTLLPSFEAAYPWLLALLATGLFAGLGVARHRLGGGALRRRRLAVGGLIAVAMVLATGSLFSAVALVNELALGNRPAIASRFGPTDPTLEPPPCTGALTAGATARIDLRLDGSVDGRRIGQAVIERDPRRQRRALERVRRDPPARRPGRGGPRRGPGVDAPAGHARGQRRRSRVPRAGTSTCRSSPRRSRPPTAPSRRTTGSTSSRGRAPTTAG